MKTYSQISILLLLLCLCVCTACNAGAQKVQREIKMNAYNTENNDSLKLRELTPEECYVIINKGTERPGTGALLHENRVGTYYCKQCGAALYRSEDKFDSHCGWPAFDDEIPGAVTRTTDADGMRTEITCAHCGAHLGHVFTGEGFTAKNTRHCVNSISMVFIPLSEQHKKQKEQTMKKAYFACGCFWGAEFYLNRAEGVKSTTVGYMGGTTANPTYEEVCTGTTGHLEVTEVEYDPNMTSYEKLVKLFFEIHDFTQTNGQGPDIGEQYLSAVFVENAEERKIVENLVADLTAKGYKVATTIRDMATFWPAEGYHQDYYDRKGSRPYCHARKQIFE